MTNTSITKKYSLFVLLFATALAFAVGLAAAQLLPYAMAGKFTQSLSDPAVSSSSINSPSADIGNSGASLDVLSQFNTTDWSAQEPAGLDALVAALPGNAQLRQAVLERYRKETTGPVKFNLARLLSVQVHPEVVAAARAWAQQADSASARADGFNLLSHMPPTPETYLLARHALEYEQDPDALAAAIWVLDPMDIPDPVEVKRVVPRLHTLTQHAQTNVRTASIQRLAAWDRARLHFTQDAWRLMADTDKDVRLAAVGATSIAALTEDNIKTRLYEILSNPKEDAELRSAALLQLHRFGLTPKEYATYLAVQLELFGKDKRG